jgi:hypothetical protein
MYIYAYFDIWKCRIYVYENFDYFVDLECKILHLMLSSCILLSHEKIDSSC